MQAQIIDGKHVAQVVKDELKAEVATFVEQTGVTPGLATVLVGEDPASQVYIKNKIRSTEACGMVSFHHSLPAGVSEDEVLQLVDSLNSNNQVHGILVQLPLPQHISADRVLQAIDPKKDVDGFHPYNVGQLVLGAEGLQPCTPVGVMELLKHYGVALSGLDVVVVGRSNIVGKPQAFLMLKEGATVTITHSKTQDLPQKVSQADVVVAAVGRPKFLQAEWLKEGCVVIDVGINRLDNGKLCGDVDFEQAKNKARLITPVPGGVGPMTIAMLLKNTLKACEQCQI